MGGLALNGERSQYLQQLFPNFYTSYVFAGVVGQPYTALEKLFIPFSYSTWIGIGIQLFLISVAAVAVKWNKFKWFDGALKNVKTDQIIFKLFSTFLGNAIVELSSRSIARFLLTLWMLTAMVLRHSYQGVMFKMLQQNGLRPPPSSIDQLTSEQYTIKAVSSSAPAFAQYTKLQNM